MKFGKGHGVILAAILISVIGTFFAANMLTGMSLARKGIANSSFAAITGNSVASTAGQISGFQEAAGSILFGMVAISALVVISRLGQNAVMGSKQNAQPGITGTVKKAEDAIGLGNHAAAYTLYNAIKEQYAQLGQEEKAKHYERIIRIHKVLSQQAAITEAQYLTDKYVGGTITDDEFERLKDLVASQ